LSKSWAHLARGLLYSKLTTVRSIRKAGPLAHAMLKLCSKGPNSILLLLFFVFYVILYPSSIFPVYVHVVHQTSKVIIITCIVL